MSPTLNVDSLYPEDGGITFVRNIGMYLPKYGVIFLKILINLHSGLRENLKFHSLRSIHDHFEGTV